MRTEIAAGITRAIIKWRPAIGAEQLGYAGVAAGGSYDLHQSRRLRLCIYNFELFFFFTFAS